MYLKPVLPDASPGFLQMQDSLLDLLRPALVPEIGADVAAGASGHIHLVLLSVAAIRALPYQFPVIVVHDLYFSRVSTDLAVIALRIQLRIHDIFVDKLHHGQNRIYIVAHVRHLHIGDRPSRRKLLKIGFKF